MTRRSADERQLNLYISTAWHECLRRRSFEERVSIAELVRKALAAAYPELSPAEEKGRKGGIVYPQGGSPASVCCDREADPAKD